MLSPAPKGVVLVIVAAVTLVVQVKESPPVVLSEKMQLGALGSVSAQEIPHVVAVPPDPTVIVPE